MADDNTFYTVTGPETVPAKITLPGLISFEADKTTITGTNFRRDLNHGDWLVDLTNNELRQVKTINSNTEAVLFVAFSNTGTTSDIVTKEASAVIYMELTGVGDALMNGTGNLRDGVPYSDGQPNDAGSAKKLVKPKIITSGTVDVNLTYISNKMPPQI